MMKKQKLVINLQKTTTKKMKKSFLTIVCLGLILAIAGKGNAQVSQGGSPLSFDAGYSSKLISNVPTAVMPFVDVEALKQEDLIVDKVKDIPWRFGQNLDVILNPANSGINEVLPNGDKLWRLRIYSKDAQTINLTFDNYHLPPGAKLFIYNDDHSDVIGAFTDYNNQDDRAFATTLVKGDAVNIEYYEPANAAFAGELNISRVTHGYRGIKEFLKEFGDAGSCNLNVACTQAAGWADQIRSVCMLVVGGSGFCTGAMINNTNNDGTPYVLTANHCYSSPSTWVFWFNYQSATCTNPGSAPTANTVSGGALKAKNSTSDFCLVQINSTPPTACNVYYSGWNRTVDNSVTGTVYGIHHPSADIKKFSYSTLGATSTTYLSNSVPGDGSHWRITSWSDGTTTEGGSSGSPLYDNNHRIIGQLHGGYASCGNTSSDWYGKFGASWTGGGTNTTRLSNWLDPGSTGVTVLDGYDPNPNVAPVVKFKANDSLSCSGNITFTDQSTNSPTSWQWSFGDGGTSTAQNPAHTYLFNGTYTVTLQATNTHGSNSLVKTDYIIVNKPAGPVGNDTTVCNPSVAVLGATGNGTIKWYSSTASTSPLYSGNTYTTPVLASTTTYYAEDNTTGAITHCGKTDSVGGGGMFTQATVNYEVFNCNVPLVLQTVKIYANAAQTGKVISLQNSSGTTLASATVNLTAGINTVTLNFNVPVDTGLRLVGPSAPGWYRNTAGVSYPVNCGSLLSVIRSSAGSPVTYPYYFYFYDWVVKEKDCISNRTAVVANVIDCSGISETESSLITISPNPVSNILTINIKGMGTPEIQTDIFNLLGQNINRQVIYATSPDLQKNIDVSYLLSGIYFIKITTVRGEKTLKFYKD